MSESDLQKSVATYLNDIQRIYKSIVWWHTPNSGQRSKRYAKWLQTQGVKAGVPDIAILTSEKPIFIELKWKSSLSEVQKNFHQKLENLDIPIYTVKAKTPSEAVTQVELILQKHGVLKSIEPMGAG